MARTREEIYLAALERRLDALTAKINALLAKQIPFVNSLTVQSAATEALKPLYAERESLRAEAKRLAPDLEMLRFRDSNKRK